ncbi:MAG: hypothetical protein WCR51_10460 [Planctomycetia bacterium]
MNQQTREWLAGLRQRVAVTRRGPGPAGPAGRGQPPAAVAAAEKMILGAHLALWIDHELLPLLAERRAARGPGTDPDPAIVITTSPVGIDVVDEAFARSEPLRASLREQVVAVTEREYREWTKAHPDADHRLHVNHWSWVKTSVPATRADEFAAYSLAASEASWLHRTGTTGCGAERRFCHLWRWNGTTATLLQPFVTEQVRRL